MSWKAITMKTCKEFGIDWESRGLLPGNILSRAFQNVEKHLSAKQDINNCITDLYT